MKHKTTLIAIVVLLCGLAMAPAAALAQDGPVVRGYLFYSASCPDCQRVRQEVIPPLYREFGVQLQIMAIEIGDPNNYQWWLACEKAYGVSKSESDVPALFIGERSLVGAEAIATEARELIQTTFAQGGVDFPDVPRPGGPLQPVVRFMYFYSPTCGNCEIVKESVFAPLKAQYGDRLQWESYSVEDADHYLALLELGDRMGVPENQRGGVPVVFLGDETSAYSLFLGSRGIPEHLPPTIEWAMAIGGVGLPGWKDELFGQLYAPPTATPTPAASPTRPTSDSDCEDCDEIKRDARARTPLAATPTAQPTAGGAAAIHMAYFAEVGCSECDRVSIALGHLQRQFPNLVIHTLDIIDDLPVNLCLATRLNVPADQWHDAPAIFVGSDYLVDRDIQYARLVEIVSRYTATGAEATWETCDEEAVSLPPPPWWAVILPGLIDGINPCAFATIVFFISYLTLLERKRHEVLMVGLSFTLAVFLSYLAFGMLLRELLAGLVDLVGPVLRPILNAAIALVCLVLAILSLDDYRKARRGRVKDMALRLPDRLRRWVNAAVRKSMNARAFVWASFVAGVVVSFIELACTGQVYVPIIQGLTNPAYRAQSTLALIVYCLAFVAPLVAVFVASYTGTSSRQLGAWLQRHTATVKVATATLFLAIGLWLVYDILRIWGVLSLPYHS
ncbi:MAG: hypothetical protein JXM73_14790 [Anaerolineae bacterium]|nr:hypothetical protein [Anaerolineae bacterium]